MCIDTNVRKLAMDLTIDLLASSIIPLGESFQILIQIHNVGVLIPLGGHLNMRIGACGFGNFPRLSQHASLGLTDGVLNAEVRPSCYVFHRAGECSARSQPH